MNQPLPIQPDVRALDDALDAIASPIVNSPVAARTLIATYLEREAAALVRHGGDAQGRADIATALARAGLGDLIASAPAGRRQFVLGFISGYAIAGAIAIMLGRLAARW